MKTLRAFAAFAFIAAVPARAVYAPIPEMAQGRAVTVTLAAGAHHDSNIFAASADEIESMVYRIAPSIDISRSLTDQTFFSAGYALSVDYVEDRPENQDLISHLVRARLAHAFSPRTTIDISDTYQVARNPESLLAGVPLNADQSFKSNQFDGRLTTAVSDRLGFTFKGRTIDFAYDNPVLAANLDRREILLGASVDLQALPTTHLLGEYRYQTVDYENAGQVKDKQSHFLLAGVDYAAGPKLSISGRAGMEFREREGAPDEDTPYAEISARYAYGELSYVSGGYLLTFEEASNVALYTDTHVNRFFVNLQHAVTPRLVGSALLNYEPSTLQGRPGASPDRDETTTRLGVALTYVGVRNWSVSATLDLDRVDSDDLTRDHDRTRIGVTARYVF